MNFNDYDFDDIEKLENSNEMVENTIQTLKNLTNDFELHHELVTNGLLECVHKYIYVFLSVAKQSNPEGINEVQEGIDLLVMSSGALQLMKAISIIILNLTLNTNLHRVIHKNGIL